MRAYMAGENKLSGRDSGDGSVVITPISLAPPSTITGTASNQTTTPITPFAQVSITDPYPGSPTETVTVTPSNAANGTLLDSVGSTVGSNGVYYVTGSASTVTTDLDALTLHAVRNRAGPDDHHRVHHQRYQLGRANDDRQHD